MKAYLIDPMLLLALRHGYNRPLDRHDFPHGSIPDSVSRVIPGVGELKRFSNVNVIGGDQGSAIETYSYEATQRHPVGTIAQTKDGRRFRYVQAGAVALVAGNVIQGPAIVPNHLALTPAAFDIGATQVTATLGATAAAANLYAEGYVAISVTPDLGHLYSISGHAAVLSSGIITLTLPKDDALVVAWTTSTRVGLLQNKHRGVIQFPVTTATGTVAGVAVSPIAISNYGWVQTKGIAATLVVGTPALGAMVMTPSTTAGTAVILTTTNLVVAQLVGRMAQVGAAGETDFVDLDID